MSNVNNNSNSNWRPLQSPDPQPSQNLRGTTRIAGTPHSQATGAPSQALNLIGPLTASQTDYDSNLGRLFGSAGASPTPRAPMERPQESRAFEEWYDSIFIDPPPHAQTGNQGKAENQSRGGSHLASNAAPTTSADTPIRLPLQPGTYKRGPLNVRPITRKHAVLQNPRLTLNARVLDPYFQWRNPSPETQPSNRHPARNDGFSHDHASSSDNSSYDDSALTSESESDQIPAETVHEHVGAEFPAPDPIAVHMRNSTTPRGDDFPLPDPIPSRPQPSAPTTANNRDGVDRPSAQPKMRMDPSVRQEAQDLRRLQADATARPTPAITPQQGNLIDTQTPALGKPLTARNVKLTYENYPKIHDPKDDPSAIPEFRKLSPLAQTIVHSKLNLLRNNETFKKSTRYLSPANHEAIYFIYTNYNTSIRELRSVFDISHASMMASIGKHRSGQDRDD